MRLKIISPSIKQGGCLVIAALLLLESVLFPIHAAAGERTLYYHNDAVGSPVAMTDSSGNVVWRADYEPFGDEWTLNETVPNSHRFTGKEVDSETDLHYFGARYYDADLGRFLSTDPVLRLKIPSLALTHPQLLNNYTYAANNPYRFIDRDGRFIFPIIVAVTSAVITNLFFSSTANAPANEQNLINAQTNAEFIRDTAIVETIGFGVGKALSFGKTTVSEIRFAQKGVSSTFRHGEFAGRAIEEVAAGLRSGAIKAEQLPIQIIEREGVTYTLNNRSLMALRQAGVESTVIQNVTGIAKYEAQLTQRLTELGGKVDPNFTPVIRKPQ